MRFAPYSGLFKSVAPGSWCYLLTDVKQAAEMYNFDKKLGFDPIQAKQITVRVVIDSIHSLSCGFLVKRKYVIEKYFTRCTGRTNLIRVRRGIKLV